MGTDLKPRAGRLALSVGAVLFCSFGYFLSGTGPNQNTRYDAVRALVEEGTLRIDSFHENTIDKAQFGGHYYSDKAAGASLLALPVYAAGWAAARLTMTPEEIRTDRAVQQRLFRAVHLACAALPAALLGVAMLLFLLRMAGPAARPGWATVTALVVALGSPLFPYATMFYGHALSAALLFLGYALLFGPAPLPRRALLLAGVAAGGATLTEYTAAPAAMLLFLVRFWPRRSEKGVSSSFAEAGRALAWLVAGGAPFALVFLANNYLVTGSFFTLGYASVEARFQPMMNEGFYGVRLPDLEVLSKILFSKYRGLFFLSPVLLVGLAGARAFFRHGRRMAIAATAAIAYFVVLNASYAVWWGGASTYPRHLTGAVAFFAPFVYFAFVSRFPPIRWATALAAAVSVANALAIVAVHPQAQKRIEYPLGFIYDQLFRGNLGALLWRFPTLNSAAPFDAPGTNLGMDLLGTRNAWSLAPLLAFWLVSAAALGFWIRRGGAVSVPAGGASPVAPQSEEKPRRKKKSKRGR